MILSMCIQSSDKTFMFIFLWIVDKRGLETEVKFWDHPRYAYVTDFSFLVVPVPIEYFAWVYYITLPWKLIIYIDNFIPTYVSSQTVINPTS